MVGISSCLLGQEVRFDGGHKRDRFLTDTLGQYVEWVPVCPEVEAGLGVPREPIRLEQAGEDTRLITTRGKEDLTSQMRRVSSGRVKQLFAQPLCGFILKKDSPSCGMVRAKDHQPKGPARRDGVGIFAGALLVAHPNLAVEEEGRLCDPRLRDNWVTRLFAYRDLQSLWKPRWKLGDVVRFHTRYKLLLMAHSQVGYRRLGKMVANGKQVNRSQFRREYESTFMQTLQQIATTKKNTNVLQHMLGYVSDNLDSPSRSELVESIEDYRRGLLPLFVPLTLIRHHVRVQGAPYLGNRPISTRIQKSLAYATTCRIIRRKLPRLLSPSPCRRNQHQNPQRTPSKRSRGSPTYA